MRSKYCLDFGYVHKYSTATEKIVSTFKVPCGKCKNCISFRKMDIYNRFIESKKYFVCDLEMWTFGTNLKYEIDPGEKNFCRLRNEINYSKVRNYWVRFMKVARQYYYRQHKKHGNFKIYLRAYEAGKNGYLHVHCLVPYVDHKKEYTYDGKIIRGLQPLYRQMWSNVTKIKNPNVNYSYRPELRPEQAIGYATKYLTKSNDAGMKRAVYIGKPLWWTYEKKKAKNPIQMNLDGESMEKQYFFRFSYQDDGN